MSTPRRHSAEVTHHQTSARERRVLARRSRSLKLSQHDLEELNSDSEVEVEENSDEGQLSKTLSMIATYGVQVTIEL